LISKAHLSPSRQPGSALTCKAHLIPSSFAGHVHTYLRPGSALTWKAHLIDGIPEHVHTYLRPESALTWKAHLIAGIQSHATCSSLHVISVRPDYKWAARFESPSCCLEDLELWATMCQMLPNLQMPKRAERSSVVAMQLWRTAVKVKALGCVANLPDFEAETSFVAKDHLALD